MTTTFNDLANVVANGIGRQMQMMGCKTLAELEAKPYTDMEWEVAEVIRNEAPIFKFDWTKGIVELRDGDMEMPYAEFEKLWKAELDRINAFLPTAKQTETGLETLANEFCELMFFRIPTEDGIGQPCIRWTEKWVDEYNPENVENVVTYMFPTAQNGCDIEYDALYAGFEKIA